MNRSIKKLIPLIFITFIVISFSKLVFASEIILKCGWSKKYVNEEYYYFITNEQLDTFQITEGLALVSRNVEIIENNDNQVIILKDNKNKEYTINFISGWFKIWEASKNSGRVDGMCTKIEPLV